MWHALLLMATLHLVQLYAEVPTDAGPAYPVEGMILWQDARTLFGLGKYKDAANLLQRIVDRHPGATGYLDAHILLGIARTRLKQPELALKPLNSFVSAAGWSPEGLRARVALGHALVGTKKFHEALLTTREILETKKTNTPLEVELEANLIKAWAEIGINQDFEAERALEGFKRTLDKNKATLAPDQLAALTPLMHQSNRIEMELKLRHCAQFPQPGRLAEAQVRDQLNRRGLCLLEALVLVYDSAKGGDSFWIDESEDAVVAGMQKLATACVSPPKPHAEQSPEEWRSYREELVMVLSSDFIAVRKQAENLLEAWKTELPESAKFRLKRLLTRIKATDVNRS